MRSAAPTSHDHMDKQRLILISLFSLLILGLASWLVYNSITLKKSTFIAGAPPKALKDVIIPANLPLSQLRPPALRPIDFMRYGGVTSSAALILFGTYRCPDCKKIEEAINEVVPKYNGMVRYIWRDLPPPKDAQALNDAVFVLCAGALGKFWEAHDALMQSPVIDGLTYSQIISALNLDPQKMATCRYNPSIAAGILKDAEIAGGDGVTSTPILFIGTEAVNQPLSADEIDKKLKLFLSS